MNRLSIVYSLVLIGIACTSGSTYSSTIQLLQSAPITECAKALVNLCLLLSKNINGSGKASQNRWQTFN